MRRACPRKDRSLLGDSRSAIHFRRSGIRMRRCPGELEGLLSAHQRAPGAARWRPHLGQRDEWLPPALTGDDSAGGLRRRLEPLVICRPGDELRVPPDRATAIAAALLCLPGRGASPSALRPEPDSTRVCASAPGALPRRGCLRPSAVRTLPARPLPYSRAPIIDRLCHITPDPSGSSRGSRPSSVATRRGHPFMRSSGHPGRRLGRERCFYFRRAPGCSGVLHHDSAHARRRLQPSPAP